MISQEDFLQTGYPSSFNSFGEIYEEKNPYVPINFLKTYPMYISPEFGLYYQDPLRGPLPKQKTHNVRAPNGNLPQVLKENYEIGRGYSLLSGGQESMQLYP